MLKTVLRLIGIAALAPVLIGSIVAAAEPERSHSFKLTLVSNMEMAAGGQSQKVEADTDLRYTWKQSGPERILSFDSSRVKAKMDGKEMMATYMSRAKFAARQDGKTEVVPFENATPELKTALQDSYEVPVCKLQVDENGKEVKREVVARAGAKDVVEQGLISNALLFHPQFLPTENEWSSPGEISMGNGGFAKGDLVYKKGAVGKGGVAVKVSGTLTNEGFSPPGSPLTINNAKYVVNGDQTFDPVQHEWVTGKLVIDISFDLVVGGNPVGQAKGTIVANLEKLPGKK